jgi:hypothetical protein
MSVVTLKAHYDGKKVCLDEPCHLPPATKLLVLAVSDSEEAFREDWFALSRQALAQAYGDDEPDYSDLLPKPPASP